jgi:hypothetical protein
MLGDLKVGCRGAGAFSFRLASAFEGNVENRGREAHAQTQRPQLAQVDPAEILRCIPGWRAGGSPSLAAISFQPTVFRTAQRLVTTRVPSANSTRQEFSFPRASTRQVCPLRSGNRVLIRQT